MIGTPVSISFHFNSRSVFPGVVTDRDSWMSNLGATGDRDSSSRESEVDEFTSVVAKSLHETAENRTGDQSTSRMADSRWQALGGVLGGDFRNVPSCFSGYWSQQDLAVNSGDANPESDEPEGNLVERRINDTSGGPTFYRFELVDDDLVTF